MHLGRIIQSEWLLTYMVIAGLQNESIELLAESSFANSSISRVATKQEYHSFT